MDWNILLKNARHFQLYVFEWSCMVCWKSRSFILLDKSIIIIPLNCLLAVVSMQSAKMSNLKHDSQIQLFYGHNWLGEVKDIPH